ncbi:MAG: cytochrome P450 [Rhodococcus sp. (in: high G+C Gram-positive bacteria)]|nr:MAG: cytochrome P450 [Rhodococcus sp. (in: high G+C Gram-positive bacteria)]
MTSTPASSAIDLFADEILTDPYPTYSELRDLGAVVHLPANDVYALTRYDAIRDALADPGTFSSRTIGFNPMVNEALQGTSLASDPPIHAELRATLTENLSPRALRGIRDRIQTKADALVADLVARGSFEAIDALARVFPLAVVADLIGFTGEVRDNMLRWGQAAMEVIGPMNQRTAENFPIAGELYGWCTGVRAEDLAPGSVGRRIFDAADRGAIPPGTAGHIIHQYLGAGVDTTIAALGNIVALLVPAGSQVAILFGAGNRDPRHYENPDAFLVERNPVDHLSFGYGPHGCAGQGLARLEAHAVIGALAVHAQRLVAADPVRLPSNITRSINTLEILKVVPA